ncbi:type II secretion system F family protein [uncultured Dermacoccus sp.]|uniref:type II secretion system F family protein n=1 Tax=uncultured Dermacoccus sp. TaxID=339343 RepID=UPI0025968A9B|nr:type II secretion system F family protein [uncultured Dermacoccus sp.]
MTVWALVAASAAAMAVWPSSARAERPVLVTSDETDTADHPLAVASTIDLLALALEGGAPAVVALEAVGAAQRGGPSTETLFRDAGGLELPNSAGSPGDAAGGVSTVSRVAAALRWGVDERSAWALAPPVWRPVATAFELAGRCGAAPSSLLRQAADDLRRSEAERVTQAGAKAGVRIVLPLGLCFLPAFILIAIVPLVLGLVKLPA